MNNKNITEIKLLSIGNSFSVNAHTYIRQIASSDGINIILGNLYIGGCTLERHWNNAVNDARDYAYYKTNEPVKISTIKEALLEEKWDYITFQQASGKSGVIQSYHPFLSNISDYVKQYVPNAEQIIHQTWAYQTGCDWEGFINYDYDQQQMFIKLKNAYKEAAKHLGIRVIIPCGEAFQNARAIIGDILCCEDKAHAGSNGCYLASSVWYETLTYNNIIDNKYTPEEVKSEHLTILKQCAHEAVINYR